MLEGTRAEVAVMTGDFPIEKDVFEFGAQADIVDNEIAARR